MSAAQLNFDDCRRHQAVRGLAVIHEPRRDTPIREDARPSAGCRPGPSVTGETPRRRCVAAAVALVTGLLAVCAAGRLSVASDEVPAPPQARPVALTGGTLYPVDRPPIPNGVLMFDKGRITAVGPASEVAIPPGTDVIDCAGKHVYPSFIALGTSLGLVEIDLVRASRDLLEVGELNPNVRAEVSVNPDSELIPVARANGVGLAMTQPLGGLISGSSALLELDGWTWEQMVVAAPLGIHVSWPSMRVDVPADPEATRKLTEARDQKLRQLDDAVREALAYREARRRHPERQPIDLRSEALLPILPPETREGGGGGAGRQRPVFIQANTAREIRCAVEWSVGLGLRPVIAGGAECTHVTELLRERGVPVIYGPVHQLPMVRDDSYDVPFTAPMALNDAGVKFAIAGFESDNARNLPYHAATAAAFGLSRDLALRSITLSAAEVIGVEAEYGSLTPGKNAALFVATGDPLEVTSQIEKLFLSGRRIELSSRHTRLYDKYRARPR